MADNKRLRILYIKDFFEQYTDEENGATMYDIMNYLKRYGIEAERRTIAEDIEALNLYGMDIQLDEKGKQRKLVERDFDLSEVRMLIDFVAASKFLTKEQSKKLIEKIQKHISFWQKDRIRWDDYQKSDDNTILYNIDAIYTALAHVKNLEFKYYHYNMKKERELAEQGKIFHVTPDKLVYDKGHCYLYTYDIKNPEVFRVDKMLDVRVVDTVYNDSSIQDEEFDSLSFIDFFLDLSEEPSKEIEVKILFTKEMMDEVIDRFGKDVFVEIVDENHFRVKAEIVPDSSFFVWMFELGENAMIEYPLKVAAQMMDLLQERYKAYREGHSRNVYAYRKKNHRTQSSESDF